MVLKLAQKHNVNGWSRQAVINFDEKTIKRGCFLFQCADVSKLTAAQFKNAVEFFKNNGFQLIED